MVDVHSPSVAPRGKLPFLKHGDVAIPDSAAIIRYILATYSSPNATHLGKLRIHLTAQETTTYTLLESFVDESLYIETVVGGVS